MSSSTGGFEGAPEVLSHEVLVIGGGLAGLRAALAASVKGVEVAVITKVHPLRSHSVAAQGGINAALREDDSVESHAYDTVKGSDYLADQDAVMILTGEASDRVREMEHWGTPFSRIEDGRICELVRELFPLNPRQIIEYLRLLRPIYCQTAHDGHFGRKGPAFTWEKTNLAKELRKKVKA